MSKHSSARRQYDRWIVLGLWAAAAWVVMTTTHELGHVIGGWLGGGKLVALEVAPWRLPYSLHAPDPHPRLTLWCGPLVGALLPFGISLLVRHAFVRFVGNFCLLANGLYLALAWWSGDQFLDTPRMLAAGVHPVWIVCFCAISIVVGYMRFRADCATILRIPVA